MRPQLSLTLTDAVIVTAGRLRELFPSTGPIANERCLTVVGPRQGWRSRHTIPLRRTHRRCADHFGVLLALAFADYAAVLPGLIFAGTDLAISRRLFDDTCLWVIAATALVSETVYPALGRLSDGSPTAYGLRLRTGPQCSALVSDGGGDTLWHLMLCRSRRGGEQRPNARKR